MANFPLPTDIESQYFQILKSIKPSLNVNDPNSDFVLRGKAFAGIVSGLYGDQEKVNNDTFISSMRPEALTLEGQDLDIPQQPPTYAGSTGIQISGPNGKVINPGDLTFLYIPTNILYVNTTGGTISGGVLTVAIKAQVTGQIGNVAAPDTLQVISPPTGVSTTAAVNLNIADGSDQESTDSYRARLLAREQNPPAGGDAADYEAFAFAADPSVRTAIVHRFERGLGTVDVYITTGTTDIDAAVTNGLSIVRVPSPTVLANVQAYYNTHVPLTDCPGVYGPTELAVNATVYVALAAGLTMSSVPSDPINNPLMLTVQQLIQRDMGRALYKEPVGGRVIPGLTGGYVTASDIEESLDLWLSAVIDTETGLAVGKIPILADRQCAPLNGSSYNFPVTANELPLPGTMTVVQGIP